MACIDLSKIVLLFSVAQGAREVALLSDNERFLLKLPDRDHDRICRPRRKPFRPASVFALLFGQHMFSPQGWTFGSSGDTDTCDFQLTDSVKTTVSRKHFQIDIDPRAHRPRITLLSANPIRIHVEQEQRKRKPVIQLDKGDKLEIKDTVIVDLGEIQLRAWQPTLSSEEVRRYRTNAGRFNEDYMDAILRLPLNLGTQGMATFTMRFGSNGACYKIDDTGPSRSGSFGSVCRVKELRSGKCYAAKLPHFRANDATSQSRARWEDLVAELSRLSNLHHPHIVHAIEVIPGKLTVHPPWLIMEWIEHDLESHLEAHRLDTDERLTLFSHVIQGLAHMHQHGLAHRDLKPSNILIHLQQDGRLEVAKIGDLGSSKYNRSDRMRSHVGTSVYMAPELWEHSLSYSNAVDLWSFGMIALQCLTEWDVHKAGWDKTNWPTKDEHLSWIEEVKLCELPTAPETFKPMLDGLLDISAAARWTAIQTGTFLSQRIALHRYKNDASSAQEDLFFHEAQYPGFLASHMFADDQVASLFHPAPFSEQYFKLPQWDTPVPGYSLHVDGQAEQGVVKSAKDSEDLIVSDFEVSLNIDGQAVTLRKEDHHVDAFQILRIAPLTQRTRKNIMQQVKRKTRQVSLVRGWDRTWITYGHALLLSDFVNVTSKLRPLFHFAESHLSPSCAAPRDDLSKYLEQYLVVRTDSASVSIRARDQWVNVSHILETAGYPQREWYKIARAEQTCENVSNVPKCHTGLYCAFAESLALCQRLGLEGLKADLEKTVAKTAVRTHAASMENDDEIDQSVDVAASVEGKSGHDGRMNYSILTEPASGDFLPQMPALS